MIDKTVSRKPKAQQRTQKGKNARNVGCLQYKVVVSKVPGKAVAV